MSSLQSSAHLQSLLERLRSGDDAARGDLIEHSMERFRALASRMMPRTSDLRTLNDSGDVLQNAMVRLYRALASIKPPDVRAFRGLAARQISFVLLDLAREMASAKVVIYTDQIPEEKSAVDIASGPADLGEWSRFHEKIQQLPPEEREAFDLRLYQGLTLEEAAEVAGVSLRTMKRRWQRARLLLSEAMRGEWPE